MALTMKPPPVKNVRIVAPCLVRGEHIDVDAVLKTAENDGDVSPFEARDIVGAGRGEFTDERPRRSPKTLAEETAAAEPAPRKSARPGTPEPTAA